MPQTILQLWDDLIGDQNKKPSKRYSWKRKGWSWRRTVTIVKPEVKNEKFINTKQISNWQDFTSRSIAPNRKNPASELNSTWAPEGKTYFGDAGA